VSRAGVTDIASQLQADEGFSGSVYQDSLGYWTIGIGTCVDARKGCAITEAEARYLLDNRIALAKTQIEETWPWTQGIDAVRFGVLWNMAYEMGISGLGGFHDFLAKLQSGDYAGASAAMLESKWAESQAPARAHRLAQQVETGQWQ